MRAKMVVTSVVGNGVSETVNFNAVSKSDGPYPADGLDENNSFAKWSPSATLSICITNPALVGKLKQGDTFYLDFTPVMVVQRT
jgi:hypothetical protein